MSGRRGRPGGRLGSAARDRFSPFAVLGLDHCDVELTDDDVRAAWRRVAAATHPDRADGGDPSLFAAAAAAYTELRTPFTRGEARAALVQDEAARGPVASLIGRAVHGRPARLALRVALAVGAAVAGILAAGPDPAGPALAVGAATWLVLTIRSDLAPPLYPGSAPVTTGLEGSDDHSDHEPT